jgi:ABC-type protease/lipase transport system fused ATPase/permease subunit
MPPRIVSLCLPDSILGRNENKNGQSLIMKPMQNSGAMELRAARRQGQGLMFWAFVFSVFVNLLMLTGPIYMLQVYDRVLHSRSVETLVGLSVLVTALYALMALLE